jgi:hypothetical protein
MAFASMVIRQQQPLTPTSPSIPTSISPAPDKIPPLPLNHTAESMVTQAGASDDTTATVIQVLSTERAALANLERIYQTERLARENIDRAVSQIVSSVNRGGKLIVCGVGKSGRVGRKVEATMNSMGIYSVFLHPTEALHGDLGVIRSVCLGCAIHLSWEPLFCAGAILTLVSDGYGPVNIILWSDPGADAAPPSPPIRCADYRHHRAHGSHHLPSLHLSRPPDGNPPTRPDPHR